MGIRYVSIKVLKPNKIQWSLSRSWNGLTDSNICALKVLLSKYKTNDRSTIVDGWLLKKSNKKHKKKINKKCKIKIPDLPGQATVGTAVGAVDAGCARAQRELSQ